MEKSTKAKSAAAKNSASTPYKVFKVYNPITDATLPHRLPLNKETESLPTNILWEQYDTLRKKYGTVPAKVTKKTYDSLCNEVSISTNESAE